MGKRKIDKEEIKVVNHVIGLLSDKFPLTFNRYERKRLPLKVGIHFDILAALAGTVTPDELKQALRVYTANKFYRAQLQPGATRFDLAGKPADVVTTEQVKPKPSPPPSSSPTRRLSLADLKAAARARRQQQQQAAK